MKTTVKTTAKTTLAVIVFGSMFAAVVPAKAAAFPVTSDTDGITIIGQQGAGYDLDKIATMTVDHDSAITTLQNGKADKMEVANMQGEINTINSNANQETANRVTADQQLQGEITQNKDAQDQVNHAFLNQNIQQDGRLSALENAPKPKDGVDGAKGDKGDTGATGANGKDGKDGANGVTTTITQVDTATQAKVAANTAAISSTSNQAAGVAQDLQDAKKVFSQQQANTNAQFKSLRDEVDGNKKEARSGAASVTCPHD